MLLLTEGEAEKNIAYDVLKPVVRAEMSQPKIVMLALTSWIIKKRSAYTLPVVVARSARIVLLAITTSRR